MRIRPSHIVILITAFFVLIGAKPFPTLNSGQGRFRDDEGWIIFMCAKEVPDNASIYRIRPDGSELQQLTHNDLTNFMPRWSPEGEWIAFVAERRNITFLWTDNDAEIYRMRPDDSDMQQLTHNRVSDTAPNWSPDGEWIVYQTRQETMFGEWAISRIRPDGSDPQRLTQDQIASSPVWSPDGQWIAYVVKNGGIYRMRSDGSEPQRLTDEQTAREPVWSPNGEWIVYVINKADIYRMRPDGSQQEFLVSYDFVHGMAWSPDSQWLAVSAKDSGVYGPSHLFLISSEGNLITKLTDTGSFGSPTWSPDGTWIVTSGSLPDEEPRKQIYLMRSDGTDRQRLTDLPCYTGAASWFQEQASAD